MEPDFRFKKLFVGFTSREVLSAVSFRHPKDGKSRIVTCSRNGTDVRIIDSETLETEARNPNFPSATYWMDIYKNDGVEVTPHVLIAAHSSGTITLWNPYNLQRIHVWNIHNNGNWKVLSLDCGDVSNLRNISGSWSGSRLDLNTCTIDFKESEEMGVTTSSIRNSQTNSLIQGQGKVQGGGYVCAIYQLRTKSNLVCVAMFSPNRYLIIDWKKQQVIKTFTKSGSCLRSISSYIDNNNIERLVLGDEGGQVIISDFENGSVIFNHCVNWRYQDILRINNDSFLLGCQYEPNPLNTCVVSILRINSQQKNETKVSEYKIREFPELSNRCTGMKFCWVDDKSSDVYVSMNEKNGFVMEMKGIQREKMLDKNKKLEKQDLKDRISFIFEEYSDEMKFKVKLFDHSFGLYKSLCI